MIKQHERMICRTGQRGAGDHYHNATVEPVLPADRPEDLIAEMIAPHTLPEYLLTKIAAHFQGDGLETNAARHSDVMERITKKLKGCHRGELVKRWALAFVMQRCEIGDAVNGLTVDLVSNLLGVSHQAIFWQIRQWEQALGISKDFATRSESAKNGHKKRRHTQMMKNAKKDLRHATPAAKAKAEQLRREHEYRRHYHGEDGKTSHRYSCFQHVSHPA